MVVVVGRFSQRITVCATIRKRSFGESVVVAAAASGKRRLDGDCVVPGVLGVLIVVCYSGSPVRLET